MTDKFEWTKDHVGCRVVYTGRNKNSIFGSVRDVMTIGSSKMIDVKLDNSTRERFYVPEDMVVLVPDEVEKALKEE